MRTLVLFRHARAEGFAPGISDETRGLVDSGRADTRATTKVLKAQGVSPDLALVSPSRRTRDTAKLVEEEFAGVKVRFCDALYLAETDDILTEIQSVRDTGCVIVVGHNPGLHDLALDLTRSGGTQNYDAQVRLQRGFPTSGAAVFRVRSVDEPGSMSGFELTDFIVPADKR